MRFAVCLLVLCGLASPLAAQSTPPTLREVSAFRTDEPPRIDGYLDELLWTLVEPVEQFVQVWPEDGSPATERTEVRIAYDEDHLYFAFQNFDANPELIRAKNLERGGRNDRDDHVYIGLDTYRDGRNAYLFEMNALGTQDDATVTDEGLTIDSFSWDAVFRSETVIDDSGWSMEGGDSVPPAPLSRGRRPLVRADALADDQPQERTRDVAAHRAGARLQLRGARDRLRVRRA